MLNQKLDTSESILYIRKSVDKGATISAIASELQTRPRTIERRLDASYAPLEILKRLDANEIGITDVETIGHMIRLGNSVDYSVNFVINRPTRRGNSTGDPLKLPPKQRKVLSRAAAKRLIDDPEYAKEHKQNIRPEVAEFLKNIFAL